MADTYVPMISSGTAGPLGVLHLPRLWQKVSLEAQGKRLVLDLGEGPPPGCLPDIAAIALLQERTVREAHGVVEQLQGALSSRVMIEQAKGVLAERAHIDVDAAFARLRAHAREHNLRLSNVARDLVDGHLNAASLSSPTRGTPTSKR